MSAMEYGAHAEFTIYIMESILSPIIRYDGFAVDLQSTADTITTQEQLTHRVVVLSRCDCIPKCSGDN